MNRYLIASTSVCFLAAEHRWREMIRNPRPWVLRALLASSTFPHLEDARAAILAAPEHLAPIVEFNAEGGVAAIHTTRGGTWTPPPPESKGTDPYPLVSLAEDAWTGCPMSPPDVWNLAFLLREAYASQDYAECDEDCAVGEDEGAGGKYASADAYEDAFHAAGGPDPSPSDAKDCNDVGWLDLSARFAALPGWASEAVVTATCGDQPASFFPGGPYRYTYDDGVFKFYECDGGQVADHGVLDLRGTTRYPVNNLSVAEIVVAHWDFFKAGHGSLWNADCVAHI